MGASNWIYFLAFIILTGCSSAPSHKESAQPKTNSSTNSAPESFDLDNEPSVEVESSPPQRIEKPATNQEVGYEDLRRAITNNNQPEVEKFASIILAKRPNDVRALNALAVMQLRKDKTSMARMVLKKAMDADPRNAALVNNYGVSFLAEGEEWRAMAEFKRAIELDPKNQSAAANLGGIHLKYHNYSEARKWLEIAYEKDKQQIRTANNFAVSLMGIGDFAGARQVLERSITPETRDPNVLLNFAILLVERLNDKTKGQEVINKIKMLAPDPGIMNRAKELEAKLR